MGKRELVLVLVFAIAGIVVYQFTAPPSKPGDRSFSVGQLVEHARRAARGNQASAQTTSTNRYPLSAGIKEIRFRMGRGTLAITGEDRQDIECELHVQSNGYDEAEALRLAKETVLKTSTAGSSFMAIMDFPEEGRQRATVRLKVPARLAVRVDPNTGQLDITNVDSADLTSARGDTTIRRVRGRVSATHVGARLTVEDSGTVKLNTRGSEVVLTRIAKDVTLTSRAGEVTGSALGGAVEIDADAADVTLEQLETVTGMLRVSAVNGTLTLRGVASEGRIDSRGADVELVVGKAAPIAVFTEEGNVTFTPPPGGYQLDAIATGGRIELGDLPIKVTKTDNEQRASGPVRGGGATITIRTARSDITVTEVQDTRDKPEGARGGRRDGPIPPPHKAGGAR